MTTLHTSTIRSVEYVFSSNFNFFLSFYNLHFRGTCIYDFLVDTCNTMFTMNSVLSVNLVSKQSLQVKHTSYSQDH
jgi:hypothetical protein